MALKTLVAITTLSVSYTHLDVYKRQPGADEGQWVFGKDSGNLGRLHLRFHGVVAVVEADTEHLGRAQEGGLESNGGQGREQIQTGLLELEIDLGPPFGAGVDESQRVLVSERRKGEDMAVLCLLYTSRCV